MPANTSNLLPSFTLSLTTLALLIGTLGLIIPYPFPHATLETSLIPPTKFITAQLPKNPLPEKPKPQPAPPPSPIQTLTPPNPSVLPAPALPQAPPLAVAEPSPTISFAIPTPALAKIVDAAHASHSAAPTTTAPSSSTSHSTAPPPPPAPPTITHLTLGQGEGNQPAPQYPREAALAHQQGTVTLRFNVDETGRVTNVEITTPCHFNLLNQAALRTVRDQWHFPPGPPRIYDVPIQFQLNQNP